VVSIPTAGLLLGDEMALKKHRSPRLERAAYENVEEHLLRCIVQAEEAHYAARVRCQIAPDAGSESQRLYWVSVVKGLKWALHQAEQRHNRKPYN
jgi:hypothetical protein